MPPTRKNLLTEDEAAAYLGVKPATLKRQRVSRINCPPYIKLGDSKRSPVRYDEAKLVAWVESRAVDA